LLYEFITLRQAALTVNVLPNSPTQFALVDLNFNPPTKYEPHQVLILNPLASKVLASVQLPSPAAVICTSGLAKVDYRIVVACRDNTIRTIKNGRLTGITIGLDAPPVGMHMQGRNIIVALADRCVRMGVRYQLSCIEAAIASCLSLARAIEMTSLTKHSVCMFKHEGIAGGRHSHEQSTHSHK
jgi:hypothetical protein